MSRLVWVYNVLLLLLCYDAPLTLVLCLSQFYSFPPLSSFTHFFAIFTLRSETLFIRLVRGSRFGQIEAACASCTAVHQTLLFSPDVWLEGEQTFRTARHHFGYKAQLQMTEERPVASFFTSISTDLKANLTFICTFIPTSLYYRLTSWAFTGSLF